MSNSPFKGGVGTRRRRLVLKSLLILSIVYLSACSPLEKTKQPLHDNSLILENGKTIGQTFQSRYNGLQGMAVYLEPDQAGNGVIELEIRPSPEDAERLAISSLPPETISSPGFYQFNFQPIQLTQNRYLYAEISISGPGSVIVGSSSGIAYINGALYRNEVPLDAQLSFGLSYHPSAMIKGVLSQLVEWFGILIAGVMLVILPGWALLSWSHPNWGELHWGVKLGLSAGISLAMHPILLLWTNMISLNLGPIYYWLISTGAAMALIWRNRQHLKWTRVKAINFNLSRLDDIALVIAILLILAVRFWSVRSLDVPMWGDSYHHSMITQLYIDNRGLFQSWEPYARLDSFTYHFGFHSIAAGLHWIAGLSAHQSVLWLGQLINALAVFSLMPLAVRLGGSTWASVVTIIAAGLFFPMPMFYVNWGRYTQLFSQVILPVMAFFVWDALEGKQFNFKIILLSILLISGLALAHYRVLIFGILFILAFFLLNLRRRNLGSSITRIMIIGVGSILIVIPWFYRVFNARVAQIFTQQVTTSPIQSSEYIRQMNAIGDLSVYLPDWIWILLVLATLWGFWRRNRGVILVSAWWALILLAANPQWLRLPGAGVLTSFAVMIGIYIPAGVILGAAVSWGVDSLNYIGYTQYNTHTLQTSTEPPVSSGESLEQDRSFPQPATSLQMSSIAVVLVLLIVGFMGARDRLSDVQPGTYVMVTLPDLKAMSWIENNLPTDTRFLVNTFSSFGGSTIAGSDAGWWLPLLTRRDTNLPPMLYIFESSPEPGYRQEIAAINEAVQTKAIDHPQVISLLKDQDITHVFIGQQQGSVGYGVSPSLHPDDLAASPHYNVIYHQDLVWIFELTD